MMIFMSMAVAALGASVGTASHDPSCAESDAKLLQLRNVVCSSLVQSPTPWCDGAWQNVTAEHDWPNQVVYMKNVLTALADPATCLTTPDARSVVGWLETQGNASVSGAFMDTWVHFQVQYYDMPRKPNTRIESPDTLGRKCWAFAYLRQEGGIDAVDSALGGAGTPSTIFVPAFRAAVPETTTLCERVLANCFENSTYTPSRNGTCPVKAEEFKYLGFDRENLKRKNIVKYPFTH